MTTPLNSQGKTGLPSAPAVASVNALQDALGRLGGGAQAGADTDFSRMVAQYRQAEQPSRPERAPAPPAAPKGSADPATRALTQRMTDQALQKARMSAQLQAQRAEQAPRPATVTAPPAQAQSEAGKAPEPARATANAARPQAPQKTDPSTRQRAEKSGADQADESDESSGELTRFNTAQGEGVAWVREISPPAGVDPSDPAGMMNWLAALTEGDPAGAAIAPEDTLGALATADPAASGTLPDLAGRGAGASLGEGAWAAAQLHLEGGVASDDPASLSIDGLTATDGTERLELPGTGSALSARHLPMAGLGAPGLGEPMGARHASAALGPAPGTGQFAQALADQVGVWVGQARADGPMTAELRLNPAELGPINIKIAVDGQAARIDFAATALETRQAIESSLGQLSRSLSDVGLSLTGGDVMSQFSQAPSGGQDQAQARGEGRGAPGAMLAGTPGSDDLVDPARLGALRPAPGGLGGLDLYA